MIPLVGWRGTYALLGLMLLLGMAPVGGLLVRNQPEAYGLQPDGAAPSDRESETHPVLSWSGEHWTLAEAVRAPGFWVLAAGFASMSLLSTGLTFHIVSIYVDNGLTPTIAASAFVPMAMTSAGTGPPRSGLGTATETGARSLTPLAYSGLAGYHGFQANNARLVKALWLPLLLDD